MVHTNKGLNRWELRSLLSSLVEYEGRWLVSFELVFLAWSYKMPPKIWCLDFKLKALREQYMLSLTFSPLATSPIQGSQWSQLLPSKPNQPRKNELVSQRGRWRSTPHPYRLWQISGLPVTFPKSFTLSWGISTHSPSSLWRGRSALSKFTH